MIEATVKMLERKGMMLEPIGELYGEFVFWILHWQNIDEKANADSCFRILEQRHFDGWGRTVSDWPEASAEYLRLCALFERKPEAC